MIVPKTLNDIKLYQWVDFIEYLDSKPEPNQISITAISLFCEISTEAVRNLKESEMDSIVSQINEAISEKPKFEARLIINDVKYGFIPNIDKLSIGEFVDLDTYQKNKKDLWKIMSVLYRPIIEEQPYGHYAIAEYDGSVNEAMKEMPVDIALGSHVFFCDIGRDLLSYIQKSLGAEMTTTLTQPLQALIKSGAGLDSFSDYVTETSYMLTKFQKSLFIQPLCSVHTK
jgi:hypothetical protein